jgi:hypothetical protein
MNLQYITDSNGQTTGVFIPIMEWNALKEKFEGIEEAMQTPDWQKQVVRERLEVYKTTKDRRDFEKSIDDIEKSIDV